MSSRKAIIASIIAQSTLPNTAGYVEKPQLNLLSTLSLKDFAQDLYHGNGNELEGKFKAVFSSSALAVNFWGPLKLHSKQVSLFGERRFDVAQFEKKLQTGLQGTPPNLDFYLENRETIIGIESKYLEVLNRQKPKFSDSYDEAFLNSLAGGLAKVVGFYRNLEAPMHLDVAQLLKHAMGILHNRQNKKTAHLGYVYWEPNNADQFIEFAQHKLELAEFSERIQSIDGLQFHAMTYTELLDQFAGEPLFKAHFQLFRERYLINA